MILLSFPVRAQVSTRGTDFWVAYMTHSNGINPPPGFDPPPPCEMQVYITSATDTRGVISVPGLSINIPFTVNANSVTPVKIPQSAYINDAGTILDKGINVHAEDAVSVYAHIFSKNRSAASLVLPGNALGRKYYVMSYTQNPASDVQYQGYTVKYRSQALVLAVEDNTTVSIIPNSSSGLPARQITLNKGQVYELQSYNDLTGTLIESVSNGDEPCKKIAVFSGSSGLRLFEGCPPGRLDGFDNLFQQLSPIASWGKEFVAVPFYGRETGGDLFRVLAGENDTKVSVDGNRYTIDRAGEYIEFSRAEAGFISSDKPVTLVQYQRGQDCDYGEGDPEMVIIAPLEQTFDHVTFLASPNFMISNHYMNVVMKAADTASFFLDGRKASGGFHPVPGNPEYAYLQRPLFPGSHTITAASGFNAMAYGMGRYESYAYTAGGNIKNLEQQLIKEPFNVKVCQDDPQDFDLVIPFPASEITWFFEDAGDPVIDARPENISTVPGEFIYAYPLNPIGFSKVGISRLTLAIKPEGSCEPPEQLKYEFEVLPLPRLTAPVIEPLCRDTTSLDLSAYVSLKGGAFSGPGVVSNYFYPREAGTGTHEITYTYSNEGGCTSSVSFSIEVLNFLALELGEDKVIDLGDAIQFDPEISGNSLSYQWVPGEGLSNSSIADPVADPRRNTTYKLIVTTPEGCMLSDEISVVVLSDITVTSAFTPNNDGVNDDWEIAGIENYPGCEVMVYNRFGNMVHYSRGYSQRWNGRKSESRLPAGTYYYVINLHSADLQPVSGSLTILY